MHSPQLGSSSSNLLELLHGGRPKEEEPHVKRSLAKKDGDGIEYIVRVDLVRRICRRILTKHVCRRSWVYKKKSSRICRACSR